MYVNMRDISRRVRIRNEPVGLTANIEVQQYRVRNDL